MKTLITILITLLLLTACTGEGYIFANGEHTEITRTTHVQKCYFPDSVTMRWDDFKITANAGDTIEVPEATARWISYDESGLANGFVVIDTGITNFIDTVMMSYEFKEYYTADSTWVTVHHSGVSVVSVDLW